MFVYNNIGTRQACAFRDDYANLTSTGLSIFGLSGDSPKANTTFQTKQKLPYPLLCDPFFKLIGAFGLKKTPKGTVRGVFAVNKEGKVLLRTPGGPEKTLNLVQDLVKGKDLSRSLPVLCRGGGALVGAEVTLHQKKKKKKKKKKTKLAKRKRRTKRKKTEEEESWSLEQSCIFVAGAKRALASAHLYNPVVDRDPPSANLQAAPF
ncbi:disrupter of telomere silencing protein Dot5, putative [Trichophyton verrucosum HKI 0517]|uniref:Disrupter of telomere silencing protein Dot5, putative n=1 Tax=Trichophyton verrucosum (strain HKI 0517) TaxID=663202 RepID=D4DK02_TRIVH|nr:disrupter of telomere silencing protein Dot5, putative [Trichophyton verrucosum HKI 0517]EFE37824.1 disrupter of telomere silencing protein Dot5, putative [Trichophyton verrucosum HKI 0517]